MKKLVCIVSALIILCAGCSNDNVIKQTYRYQINEPVFMDVNEFRELLSFTEVPQSIEQQGKICFYKGYLYISEPDKGIHIIDNQDPSNPLRKGFVELAGNHDIAVKDNLLYADALIDLVWFDLTDPSKPEYKGRLENIFVTALPPCENGFGYDYKAVYEGQSKNQIVVGWTVSEREEVYEVSKDDFLNESVASPGGGGTGVNGSFSLFSLYQKYLYTVINSELTIFEVSSGIPVKVG
ncbi:MAG: hypothetical protein LIP01_09965 [Tannerellaceae bacterium]|nr:hypothetical protein [Tannerellaceae bacterium]